MKVFSLLISTVPFFSSFSLSAAKQAEKMNVLFLMADDMRPELGCYGVEAVKTPNIDRLASTGVLFQNAYCNVPVSGASRASLLTGVYPHYPDRFVGFSALASKDCPAAIPLSG
jgi:arylsulfatase A-like enzyme